MFGEIGLFSPHKQRIATAVAATPVEVMVIAEDRVIALYTENREFGFYLVSLITRLLLSYPQVHNYVGSWQECGNREGLPIVGVGQATYTA